MRNIIIAGAAAVALCACATDESVQRQAALNCEAVGIGAKDPQFGTCTQAYSQRYLEDQIRKSYRNPQKTPVTDAERRLPHQDVNF
jgi:hypothetical protein